MRITRVARAQSQASRQACETGADDGSHQAEQEGARQRVLPACVLHAHRARALQGNHRTAQNLAAASADSLCAHSHRRVLCVRIAAADAAGYWPSTLSCRIER